MIYHISDNVLINYYYKYIFFGLQRYIFFKYKCVIPYNIFYDDTKMPLLRSYTIYKIDCLKISSEVVKSL